MKTDARKRYEKAVKEHSDKGIIFEFLTNEDKLLSTIFGDIGFVPTYNQSIENLGKALRRYLATKEERDDALDNDFFYPPCSDKEMTYGSVWGYSELRKLYDAVENGTFDSRDFVKSQNGKLSANQFLKLYFVKSLVSLKKDEIRDNDPNYQPPKTESQKISEWLVESIKNSGDVNMVVSFDEDKSYVTVNINDEYQGSCFEFQEAFENAMYKAMSPVRSNDNVE